MHFPSLYGIYLFLYINSHVFQVRCQENVFSNYIKKYFAESKDFWALDDGSTCKVGDHVLIKIAERSQRPTSSVMHHVDRVIFQFGNLIDPITKKRVINGLQYEDEIVLKTNLVEEIVEEPYKEEALLFDEKRAIQQEKLQEKTSEVKKQ